MDDGWKWFSGTNDEYYSDGPFNTRGEAIEALEGEGGYIIEARQDPLKLSQHIDFERALEDTEEDFERLEEDDSIIFDCTQAQQANLIDRLKTAVNDWQTHHELVFKSVAFTASRNGEFIDAAT